MNFNKKIKTIFLDPKLDVRVSDEKINIILSPSLYWVKKLSLPITNIKEVKKLLPSIFEDEIEAGEYNYYVYKKEDFFIAIAYDDKKILQIIKEKQIPLQNIAKVYFAQTELTQLQLPLHINKIYSVIEKDDIVLLLPYSFIKQETNPLVLDQIKHTKHHITLTQYSNIVDKKSLYTISAVLVLAIILSLSELFITQQKLTSLTNKQEQIFTKYHLKPTMFQNKSLLKQYQKIYTKQTKIREDIAQILAIRLKKGQSLTNISFEGKKIIAVFEHLDNQTQQHIKQKLKTKHIPFKISHNNKTFTVEITL